MRLTLFIWIWMPCCLLAQGSFAPAVGQPGSTAIHKDSSVFVGWATNCITNRGPQDIAVLGSPLVTLGDDYNATDKSGVNGTVSLGDGGEAILTFDYPIVNGSGWDFAIFENSFDGLFLELAFVEVSSDGINYFRFPATSEVQHTVQTDGFGETDPTEINNLAGKYKAQYGTPFDLDEMVGINGLNVDSITHVKIVDVIGTIDEGYASHDQFGNKINDPYPTDFPSGGFDLDAVGVIHQDLAASKDEHETSVSLYPTATSNNLTITTTGHPIGELIIYSLNGQVVMQVQSEASALTLNVENLENGIYLMSTASETMKFIKY